MKWGYKYENGDLVLNEKAEGEELTRQGAEIWCKQEAAEYYTGFGLDRRVFTAGFGVASREVAEKLNEDIYLPPSLKTSFEIEMRTSENLHVKVTFKP